MAVTVVTAVDGGAGAPTATAVPVDPLVEPDAALGSTAGCGVRGVGSIVEWEP